MYTHVLHGYTHTYKSTYVYASMYNVCTYVTLVSAKRNVTAFKHREHVRAVTAKAITHRQPATSRIS